MNINFDYTEFEKKTSFLNSTITEYKNEFLKTTSKNLNDLDILRKLKIFIFSEIQNPKIKNEFLEQNKSCISLSLIVFKLYKSITEKNNINFCRKKYNIFHVDICYLQDGDWTLFKVSGRNYNYPIIRIGDNEICKLLIYNSFVNLFNKYILRKY